MFQLFSVENAEDPILCEIENEKRRFSIRIFRSEKKSFIILRKAIIYIFLIENPDRRTPFFVFDLA